MCHSQIRHLRKTAQTWWAALIFPYKSVLSPLNHVAGSSLNSLQFVSILPGPSCLKVNPRFLGSEPPRRPSPPPADLAQGPGSKQSRKWPDCSVQRGQSSCSRAVRSLFLASDGQAAHQKVCGHPTESHIAGDVPLSIDESSLTVMSTL